MKKKGNLSKKREIRKRKRRTKLTGERYGSRSWEGKQTTPKRSNCVIFLLKIKNNRV